MVEFEIVDDEKEVDELFEEEEKESKGKGRRSSWDLELFVMDLVQMDIGKVYKTTVNKFVNRYYALDDEPDEKKIKRFLRRARKEVDFEYKIEDNIIYIRRK